MNRRKFLLKLNKIVFYFEVAISVMLLVGILISVPDIIKYYFTILGSPAKESMNILRDLLSHVFLLVIAMEFILLLVAHNDATIIHLVILVIARKMLIYSDHLNDILIGVISLAVVFIIRKYWIQTANSKEFIMFGENRIFSASSIISKINDRYNYDIEAEGIETLGGLVSHLLEEKGEDPEVGTIVDDGKYIYEIHSLYDEGLIEEISIHNIK
ncbi:hypothetical protein O6R05_00050 [Peptoniphilus equinus]|uniref:Transporter associated domain-containing protein n=1 Tax=Peptoniphilus equinus TaxID=3016343 RepID=A0ABY7QUP1_9FIRM|nr:transporter associated domain-containing protein [Peptoniphilus equinus]WBW49995.1 hypothetical protein O6R05_00050 [Peptoniphilus equinus]